MSRLTDWIKTLVQSANETPLPTPTKMMERVTYRLVGDELMIGPPPSPPYPGKFMCPWLDQYEQRCQRVVMHRGKCITNTVFSTSTTHYGINYIWKNELPYPVRRDYWNDDPWDEFGNPRDLR